MRLRSRGLTGFIGLIIVIFLTEGFPVTVIAANQEQKKVFTRILVPDIFKKI